MKGKRLQLQQIVVDQSFVNFMKNLAQNEASIKHDKIRTDHFTLN